MKKSMFIIAMLLIAMVSKSQVVYNYIDFKYTPFIYAIANELQIESDIYLVQTTVNVKGYVLKKDFGYIIYVNSSEMNAKDIIAHEMVHIWQSESGRLDMSKPYYSSKRMKYLADSGKEFEKEANKLGTKLYYKYK